MCSYVFGSWSCQYTTLLALCMRPGTSNITHKHIFHFYSNFVYALTLVIAYACPYKLTWKYAFGRLTWNCIILLTFRSRCISLITNTFFCPTHLLVNMKLHFDTSLKKLCIVDGLFMLLICHMYNLNNMALGYTKGNCVILK